jgi:hypothetical protein
MIEPLIYSSSWRAPTRLLLLWRGGRIELMDIFIYLPCPYGAEAVALQGYCTFRHKKPGLYRINKVATSLDLRYDLRERSRNEHF